MKILLAPILAIALTLPARAQAPGEAKVFYERGVAAYSAKDYDAAVAAFKAAYELDARPEILFAWAQAERLNGNCAGAIVLYRRFLDGHPPRVQAEAAQTPLARCERALEAATPAPAPAPEPQPEPAAPAPAMPAAPAPEPSPPPKREGRRFYQDALGDVLVGGGIAAAAAGAVLLATAGSPDGATTWDDFRSRHDDATQKQRWGAVALGVGAALVAGGVTHWIVWTHGDEAVGVAVAGRF